MGFFSNTWSTYLEVDAGPEGLGCTLWQSDSRSNETKVIKFDSRLLTDTEQRYSQCEKEGLAAVWGCEKNEIYLIGRPFYLITDNKGFTIIHRPGKSNISDYLSRNPIEKATTKLADIFNAHATNTTNSLLPKVITLKQVQDATDADPLLQTLKCNIARGHNSKKPPLKPFNKITNHRPK